MTTSSNPQHEPTMEEILASIRKIISEDSGEPAPPPAMEAKASQEPEILELTQEVHEEPPPAAAPQPAPPPVATVAAPQPIEAALQPVAQPALKPVDDVVFEPIEESPVSSQASTHSSEGIFSDKSRKALSDAFSSLEPETVHDRPATAVPPVNGLAVESVFERAVREAFEPVLEKWLSDNAESIVESMKPAISEWLDEHFPAMLEDAVRNEVARIAKARSRR